MAAALPLERSFGWHSLNREILVLLPKSVTLSLSRFPAQCTPSSCASVSLAEPLKRDWVVTHVTLVKSCFQPLLCLNCTPPCLKVCPNSLNLPSTHPRFLITKIISLSPWAPNQFKSELIWNVNDKATGRSELCSPSPNTYAIPSLKRFELRPCNAEWPWALRCGWWFCKQQGNKRLGPRNFF